MDNIVVKVVIDSQLSHLEPLRRAIHGICACKIENKEILSDIELSIQEAVTNVINHAYQSQPGHEILIIVSLLPNEITLEIVDSGLKNDKKTDVTQHKLAEIDITDIQQLPESGMGLFLIHQLMDKVAYTSLDGSNRLILHKSIITRM